MSVVYEDVAISDEQQQMVAPAVAEEIAPVEEVQPEGVEVAVGPASRKAAQFISRNAPGFGPFADTRNRPGNDAVSDAAAGKAVDAAQSTGTLPIAIVDKGDIITRAATAEEMAILQGYSSSTSEELAGMDVILPNLSKIGIYVDSANPAGTEAAGNTLADSELTSQELDLRRLITATFDAYKETVTGSGQRILRKGERGFAAVIADADKIGAVDIFLELMKREPGDRLFTDAELLAARRTVASLQLQTMSLVRTAKETGDPLDKARAAQAFALEGYSSIQLHGVQEDAGRLLATNKIISSPSKERVLAMRQMMETRSVDPSAGGSAIIDGANLQEFLDANGGEAAIDFMLQVYDDLPTDLSRHEFARRSIGRRAGDMLVEIYQSALLSNPLTHSYNFASNVIMMETLMIERFLEGRPKEAFSMLVAQPKYFMQALRAGGQALMHEGTVTGNSTKLDVNMRAISRQGAGLRNAAEGGGTFAADGMSIKGMESAAAGFFDGFGVMMRLLGFRPMLGMDESFKSMGRGMQLEALATRAQSAAFNSALDSGISREAAGDFAAAAHLRTLRSRTAFDQANEFAAMMTFQDDLPGGMGAMQGFFSHPITKIWVPFYKTPTQVMRRIMERTPMGLLMPTVLRDKIINGSNADRREAGARIATGTGIFSTLMYMGVGGAGDNFTMTGYGPTDKQQRKTWLENNEPYSVGIRKADGSGKWTWTSYARYDPFSGILAASMDTAATLQHTDDMDMVDNLVLNGGIAVTRYVGTSLPMLQFVGELIDVAGSPYEEHDSKVARIAKLFTKQAASAGLIVGQQVATAGLGSQGMLATFERYLDPYSRDSRPENQYDYVEGIGLQPQIRGMYEAMQYARSRIPGLSKDLPIKRNRWYEPAMQGVPDGGAWQMFVPMRVLEKPGANIINQELNKLKLGFKNLSNSMNEPKIKLTGTQYEKYTELYNFPGNSKFAKSVFKGKVPPSVLDSMLELISPDGEYNKLYEQGNPAEKIKMLRAIDGRYQGIAKQLMLFEFDELRAQVDKVARYKNYRGRNPPMIGPATDSQLSEANAKNLKALGQ